MYRFTQAPPCSERIAVHLPGQEYSVMGARLKVVLYMLTPEDSSGSSLAYSARNVDRSGFCGAIKCILWIVVAVGLPILLGFLG